MTTKTPEERNEELIEEMLPELCECIIDVSEERGALWGKHIEPNEVPEYFKILLRTVLQSKDREAVERIAEAVRTASFKIVQEFKDNLINIAIENEHLRGCVTSNQINKAFSDFEASTHNSLFTQAPLQALTPKE